MTAMLAAYHNTRAPIARVESTDRMLPLAVTQDGTLLLVVPVDYINWQKSTAEAASDFLNSSSLERGAAGREVWIDGRVSEQARLELSSLGWAVFETALTQLATPADEAKSSTIDK